MIFFNLRCFFSLTGIKRTFLFSSFLWGSVDAQEVYGDALFPFNENISISGYLVDYVCSYENYKHENNYFIDRSAVGMHRFFSGPAPVEKYVIRLQSKYKMFSGYNNYSHVGDGRIHIQSSLHEIYPAKVDFHSKADVDIYLNGEQFAKLIQIDRFFVYYPKSVFDYNWVVRLSRKNNVSNVFFSSALSSIGLERYRKACLDDIESQKVELERVERERNKPVNRIKNFFGV